MSFLFGLFVGLVLGTVVAFSVMAIVVGRAVREAMKACGCKIEKM